MAPRRQVGAIGEMPPGVVDCHVLVRVQCCVPSGDCLRPQDHIAPDDPRDAVRVTCNNDACTAGRYMHRECFELWEQTVLTYLKSCGRARSWSERQRHQNLWTKKGYDLAFKACGCLCGRGHLKKDLDWTPRSEDHDKRRRRRARNAPVGHPKPGPAPEGRGRAESLSSSGSCSPPSSDSPTHPHGKNGNSKTEMIVSDRIR